MIGWYFDIVVGFLIRTVIRFVKIRSSETWPVEKAHQLCLRAREVEGKLQRDGPSVH